MPPVAQNVQPIPQPIWDETHTVIRPLAAGGGALVIVGLLLSETTRARPTTVPLDAPLLPSEG